jgi:hypothetical protein
MPKIIEKGTPMSQVMIVVEFETKPEHRSQFIDLRTEQALLLAHGALERRVLKC